jgi:sugar phosphate isomerase/epimerase
MQLCLSARMFASSSGRNAFDIDLEGLINFAKDLGYDGITLRPGQVDADTPAEEVTRIADLLKGHNVPCSFVKSMAIRDLSTYEEQCKLLDHMAVLGCTMLQPKVGKESDIPWVQKLCDSAAERDMQVAPQLHNGTLHDTAPRCLDLVKAIDRSNFGINFEASHLLLQSQDIQNGQAVRDLGPHISSVCIQNYKLIDSGSAPCLPGDPEGVDLHDVFGALKEVGFKGFVTHISGAYPNLDNRAMCDHYVKYLRPLMG